MLHTNALFGVRHGDGFGHADDAGLARGIGDIIAAQLVADAGDRCDVDHHARPLRLHDRQDETAYAVKTSYEPRIKAAFAAIADWDRTH